MGINHTKDTPMNNQALIAIIVIVLAVGGYMIYKEQNTTTIDLPGDAQIEISE
jgi:hypothetical protein